MVFLGAAVPVAAVALAVLVAGWVAVAVLAITPLVIPALVAFRAAVGGAAWLDALIARGLLGTSARPPLRSPGPRGFWRSGLNVLEDGPFWRQQSYLLIRLSAGFVAGILVWSLLAAGLGCLTLPAWYSFTNGRVTTHWHVDSLGRALLFVPAGIGLLAVLAALLLPLERASRGLVSGLLCGPDSAAASPEAARRSRRRALEAHYLAYGILNLLLIAIWALTPHGTFWPAWTLIALGLPLGAHACVELVDSRRWPVPRTLALHAGLSVVVAAFFTLLWVAAGFGYFWPVWPILVLAIMLAVHAAVALPRRSQQQRIAELEESRAGAVDLQESELERIERDLHDGAQARLVALGMQLGLAEQKLASDPEGAQALLAEARQGTREALEELRDLARGIRPPVLADRGLEPAVAALADRTPLDVTVAVELPRRPPRAVETAAYFVVAEALANSGKHAHAGHVGITLREQGAELLVEVVDDGVGGADPSGSGLQGLARRVGALDGRLDVESPSGGPTRIRAVIPCGS
jgi:signal transduction histidine kinase